MFKYKMDTYTINEVKSHNTSDSCWIIIREKVYDVTTFLSDHPGGKSILLSVGGKDCTESFEMFHRLKVLETHAENYLIGNLI